MATTAMEKYFIYLDGLRESGETNMFGAVPYLMEEFNLTRQSAIIILSVWMDTFNERHPDKEDEHASKKG